MVDLANAVSKKLNQSEVVETLTIKEEGSLIDRDYTAEIVKTKWNWRNLDPRVEDLADDHELWHYFLNGCLWKGEEELLAAMIFVRAMGARILEDSGKLVIRPYIDESGRLGWESKAKYDEWISSHNIKRFFPVIIEILAEIHKKEVPF